ncbi:MAG TPA: cohesin domain-containing protein [Candidatus Polarisedimenticolaceae bacterium]
MIGIGVRGLLFGSALVLTGCGGGGGGSDAGTGPNPSPDPIIAAFAADTTAPGGNTVSMLEGSKSGDTVTVRVAVTNTTALYATAFDLTYDDTQVTYVSHSAGQLFEQGGHAPTYQVNVPDPGRVVVAVSRNGNVGTVNASGTVDAVRLTFRVRAKGASRAEFGLAPVLYDGQPTPQPKPGINWTAGTFQGS